LKRCDHVSVVSMSFILFSPRTFSASKGHSSASSQTGTDYLRGLPRTARGQPMDIIQRMQSQGTFSEGSQGFPWDTGTFRTRETSLGGHGLSVEPDDRQLSYIFMLIMSLHGKVLPSYKRLPAAITPDIIPGTFDAAGFDPTGCFSCFISVMDSRLWSPASPLHQRTGPLSGVGLTLAPVRKSCSYTKLISTHKR
jgi:hypothetical protein